MNEIREGVEKGAKWEREASLNHQKEKGGRWAEKLERGAEKVIERKGK